jgi:hypothetical protein
MGEASVVTMQAIKGAKRSPGKGDLLIPKLFLMTLAMTPRNICQYATSLSKK